MRPTAEVRVCSMCSSNDATPEGHYDVGYAAGWSAAVARMRAGDGWRKLKDEAPYYGS